MPEKLALNGCLLFLLPCCHRHLAASIRSFRSVKVHVDSSLDNVPNVLGSVAELAASNTGRERVIADRNGVVLELVREVVIALGHCTYEDADALFCAKVLDVVAHSDHGCVEGQSNLSAVWW